jgi:hypothetical protein
MLPFAFDSPNFLLSLIPIILWAGIWKGIGLWKAGKNRQLIWFIAMFIFNTAGLLPIIYIVFFQKKKKKKKK